MKYYRCGKILKTHGIKGDLKIQLITDFDRFEVGKRLYILHNNEYIEVKVAKASNFGNYKLVAFEGLLDINLVLKYHGDEIYVSEEDREDLDDGYYYSDLEGKTLINQNGEERGKVTSIQELPHAIYLVVSYNNKEVMVPFIDEFILDVTDEYIKINEIEGLFWK